MAASTLCACEKPFLARDGTLTFPERGAHGAGIVTANGIEYRDRLDVPDRVVVRDANEPWRPPIGFILPRSGRFHATSRPTVAVSPGLRVFLRPSDTRVPAWGGEVLVRVDVQAPLEVAEANANTERERVAIVIDGEGDDAPALARVALAQLAARDRVAVVDARDAKVVVPMMPASHRSLVLGALGRRLAAARGAGDLATAIAKAGEAVGTGGRVVILTDGAEGRAYGPAVGDVLTALASRGTRVSAFGTAPNADSASLSALTAYGGGASDASASLDARAEALRQALPAGPLAFQDVVLTFEGTPAPSHVLEASGGDVTWRLDAGELLLGDIRAGEARTEVVRVTVPAWVAGESFAFTVHARATDVALRTSRDFSAELPCVYDDDLERIAESRHGDVIAYASALATLSRLDAAFLADTASSGARTPDAGVRKLARMHARSLSLLARDMHDSAMEEQAAVLEALLGALDGP